MLGFQGQAAVGYQGNAIGSYESAAAVVDRLLLQSEDLLPEWGQHTDEDVLTGNAGMGQNIQGVMTNEGSIEAKLNYGISGLSSDILLAAALGSNSWDSDNSVNQLTIQDDIKTFLTLAILKSSVSDANVYEIIGAFLGGFSLNIDGMDSAVTFSPDIQANDIINSGTTNSASTINALTKLGYEPLLGRQATFYLTNDFTDAIASGDEISVNSLTLDYDNSLQGQNHGTPNTDYTNSQKPRMPKRDGKYTASLSFTNEDNIATLVGYKRNNTMLQGKLVFNNDASSKSITLFYPHIRINEAPDNIDGTGVISPDFSCDLYSRDTTYDVMKFQDSTSIDKAIAIEIDNHRTGAILS